MKRELAREAVSEPRTTAILAVPNSMEPAIRVSSGTGWKPVVRTMGVSPMRRVAEPCEQLPVSEVEPAGNTSSPRPLGVSTPLASELISL